MTSSSGPVGGLFRRWTGSVSPSAGPSCASRRRHDGRAARARSTPSFAAQASRSCARSTTAMRRHGTVYVTHDQLEAIANGDKIVVMNHCVVEQFGRTAGHLYTPSVGCSSRGLHPGLPRRMNFLRFPGHLRARRTRPSRSGSARSPMPRLGRRPGGRGDLRCSSSVRFRPRAHRDSARGQECDVPAEVLAAEYLDTTQIVTFAPHTAR